MARSWLTWGKVLTAPAIGCVAIFSSSRGPRAGHVGFYTGETSASIKLLGGNQSNEVNISNYSMKRCLGYRWPGL
jgi:uncharacterized protein (TIGR02594 family)